MAHELRCRVEQRLAHLHSFRHLRMRDDRRDDVHLAFLRLACDPMCQTVLRSNPGESSPLGQPASHPRPPLLPRCGYRLLLGLCRCEERTRKTYDAPRTGVLMSEFFMVMMFEPRTRAPAAPPVEGLASPDALRALMVRTPAVDRPGLLSWGDVTRAELEALARAGHLDLDDQVEAHPSEQPIWSLFSARP